MKKILVLKGESAYNVLRRAADEICDGFMECGYSVDLIDYREENAWQRLLNCIEHKERYAFYFSIQALGWELENDKWPQLAEIQRVGWIVDDPVYHSARLFGSMGRDAHVLTVRDSYKDKINAEYPKFERVGVLYHGGFKQEPGSRNGERNIDVFFPGTYMSLRQTEKDIDGIEGVFGQVARAAKERIVGKYLARDWREGIRDYLDEVGFEISGDEFEAMCQVLWPLDAYQRAYMRVKIVEALLLSGIEVTVTGAGWDNYEGAGIQHLKVLSGNAGSDISEVLALMGQSKIVLNNTNILDGMHERIFSAMLARAVCVTNEYSLVNEFFEDGKDIVTFSLTQIEKLPQVVRALLEDRDKMEQIANAGYKKAVEKHTWQHRGKQIVKWMETGDRFIY